MCRKRYIDKYISIDQITFHTISLENNYKELISLTVILKNATLYNRPAVENQKIKCNEPMGYTPISYVIGKRNDGTIRIMMP